MIWGYKIIVPLNQKNIAENKKKTGDDAVAIKEEVLKMVKAQQ